MNCFHHPQQEVTTICAECGKGLCLECASAFEPCLCPECASARSKAATIGEAAKIFAKSAIFFLTAFVFVSLVMMPADSGASLSMRIAASLVFSGIPWGWSLVSRILPLEAGGSAGFVVAFYLVKLIAAYFIGLLVMLWNILKMSYLLVRRAIEKKNIRRARQLLSVSSQE